MKKIIFLLLLIPVPSLAQTLTGWLHLDPSDDKKLGISTTKAYNYLRDMPSDTVIVAVIDNGAEVTHEDLRDVIWVNRDEIAGDNKDNDNNGFIDDIYGWNFLGNAKGENIKRETTELTRCYGIMKKLWEEVMPDTLDPEQRAAYKLYTGIREEYLAEVEKNKEDIRIYSRVASNLSAFNTIITKFLGRADYTTEELKKIETDDKDVTNAKNYMLNAYKYNLTPETCASRVKTLNEDLDTRLNPDFDVRARIIGDNTADLLDSDYGNGNVGASGPFHGTGVASVIGAVNNDFGVSGIARKVKLMIIRIVPNGDERDKDFYLAVKYAIDNGASVINCSFAKRYSMNPEFARKAVSLAEKAGVLIINGAGNDAADTDIIPFYPEGIDEDGMRSEIWMNVGASMPDDDEKLAAPFSNYGHNSVDLFAPGYEIDNCVLRNGYGKGSGTSISAPVVAGIAAVLKSYYPELSGSEIKKIIMKSVYIPSTMTVIVPGTKDTRAPFSTLSSSGGIANLYNAVLLATEYHDRKRSGSD